jgi:hypothetical protein
MAKEETYRSIAEIVDELDVIEAEAKETDKALRKILKQLGVSPQISQMNADFSPDPTVKESLTTATDGKQYRIKLYNLDAILAVGYRVRSPRGVQFRRWATTVLGEYLRKGFVMDDERLKNPDGRPDYSDEMRPENKDYFRKILRDFMNNYRFNPELFPETNQESVNA